MASVSRLKQDHTTSSIALMDRKVQLVRSSLVILLKNGRRMRSIRRGGSWSKSISMNFKDRRCGKECMKSSPAVLSESVLR